MSSLGQVSRHQESFKSGVVHRRKPVGICSLPHLPWIEALATSERRLLEALIGWVSDSARCLEVWGFEAVGIWGWEAPWLS